MNVEVLKNKIQQSELTNEEKKILFDAVDSFGGAFADFISSKLNSSGFDLEKKYILTFALKAQDVFLSLTKGDSRPYIEFLNASPESGEYDFGKYLLPIVLDIETISTKRQLSISPELYQAISHFKVKLFKKLPNNQVITILKTSLLFFLDKVDLVFELKRRYVLDDAEYIDDWGKQYLQALQQNEEILGSGNIMVEGKGTPPFIKNWIQDFVSFLPTPINQRTALEEAQYFAKSSNLKVLSAEEKKLLQEILQLHDWLLHPFATYEEIELAESGEKESTSDGNRPAPKAQAVQSPVVVPRNTPKPSPAPTPRPNIPAPMQIPLQRSMPNLQDMLQGKDRRRGFGDITKNTGAINQARTPIAPTPRPAQGQRPQAPAVNPEIEKRLEQLRSRITKDS